MSGAERVEGLVEDDPGAIGVGRGAIAGDDAHGDTLEVGLRVGLGLGLGLGLGFGFRLGFRLRLRLDDRHRLGLGLGYDRLGFGHDRLRLPLRLAGPGLEEPRKKSTPLPRRFGLIGLRHRLRLLRDRLELGLLCRGLLHDRLGLLRDRLGLRRLLHDRLELGLLRRGFLRDRLYLLLGQLRVQGDLRAPSRGLD